MTENDRGRGATPRGAGANVSPMAVAAISHPLGLLDEKEVAALLGLEPATLRNWRVKREGPRWVQLSRRAIRYRPADIDAWVASRTRRSTSDTESENE